MNTNNYASLEASRRLVDAGIVLKTDFYWYLSPLGKTWEIRNGDELTNTMKQPKFSIPAPSMAEVWRELPNEITLDGYQYFLIMERDILNITKVGYSSPIKEPVRVAESPNPADAMIHLLILLRRI